MFNKTGGGEMWLKQKSLYDFLLKNTENINCTEWSATLHMSKLQYFVGNILDSLYVE